MKLVWLRSWPKGDMLLALGLLGFLIFGLIGHYIGFIIWRPITDYFVYYIGALLLGLGWLVYKQRAARRYMVIDNRGVTFHEAIGLVMIPWDEIHDVEFNSTTERLDIRDRNGRLVCSRTSDELGGEKLALFCFDEIDDSRQLYIESKVTRY